MFRGILPPVGDPEKGLLFICELILDKEENNDGRLEQPRNKENNWSIRAHSKFFGLPTTFNIRNEERNAFVTKSQKGRRRRMKLEDRPK